MTDERLRVLLAEDDRAVRESLARAMTLEGYEVSAVNDGLQLFNTCETTLSMPLPTSSFLTCQCLRLMG